MEKKSVIADESEKNLYTLDHLGLGPHPQDYKNGVALKPGERQQKLPNGFVYDPEVTPESTRFVDFRLRIMRDGIVGSMIKSFDRDYEPKLAKLLVLVKGKLSEKVYGKDLDYEKDIALFQEPPPVDAVFFSCTGCHQGRVIIDGKLDKSGNIVQQGRMKFIPGMPNTEIEAQYFSRLLMESGMALIESGYTADSTNLAEAENIVPSQAAILALYTRMLSRAIDPETVKSIYGASEEQVKRAKLQTHAVAKNFPKYVGDLIGTAVKTQYIYRQLAGQNAYNPNNPHKSSPSQVMPEIFNNRIGQMDAFGMASGLVAIHSLRKDDSYLKFMYQDNPENPIFSGLDTVPGFSGKVTAEEAGKRILANSSAWLPPVAAPVDVKSLNWTGHRTLANWDGNQGAAARTLASGVSATGDPMKVNVRIHEPLNPFINNMPPPAYPFSIDVAKAKIGMEIFNGKGLSELETCTRCHQANSDLIVSASSIGVDENRTLVNTDVSRYGLAGLVMEACQIFIKKNPGNEWCLPHDEDGNVITDWKTSNDDYFKDTPGRVRDGKNGYKADMLHGLWARAPFLHNGSVPTLAHMLCSDTRPDVFNRGVLFYDENLVGFEWLVTPRQRYSEHDVMQVKKYDTRDFSRSNKGHTFGSSLCPDTSGLDPVQDRDEITKRITQSKTGDLLEYLKTL